MTFLIGNLWLFWAITAVLCLITELLTGGFFLMCFAIGAAVAAIISPIAGFNVQLAVFAVVSVLCIFFVRPFAIRYLHNDDEKRVSNADAILGAYGIVSQTIEPGGFGRVAIDGDDWKAQSEDGVEIGRGEKVVVVGRDSLIITVKRHIPAINN